MNQKSKVSKDFIMVVIGQIISLFGNAVIRFALPIHLLDMTGSAALLGVVSGCAFLPLALMSPIGGLIADRCHKRNIMVALDFFTAVLVLAAVLLYGKMNLVVLVLVMLFLLYGISGAYQPSVQASIPLLVADEQIMPANAAINMISSLSGMLGPALGGMAYQAWGILPVLYVCVGCFFFSAVMEIFIHIPHEKRVRNSSLLLEAKNDLKESLVFLSREKPEIGKLTICCAGVNFALSSLMTIGLPVIVMERLEFPGGNGSQMYGFLEAILAVGGLAGGLGAGVFASKLKVEKAWKILAAAGLCLLPMGGALLMEGSVYLTYGVLALTGFVIMALASLYSIQIMSYIQLVTPSGILGKVIACVIAVSTCAQPAGQIVYGFLFDNLTDMLWVIFAAAAFVSALIGIFNRKISERL